MQLFGRPLGSLLEDNEIGVTCFIGLSGLLEELGQLVLQDGVIRARFDCPLQRLGELFPITCHLMQFDQLFIQAR